MNKIWSSVISCASSSGFHRATDRGGKSHLSTRGSSSPAPGRSLLLACSSSQLHALKEEAILRRKNSGKDVLRSCSVNPQQPGQKEVMSVLHPLMWETELV